MNDDQYHIIEQYLNGELEGDALNAFEAQLKTDPSLVEATRIYKMLNNEMPGFIRQQSGAGELRKTLEATGPAYFKDEARVIPINRNKKYWFAAAASLIIIVTSALLWQNNEISTQDLYAQYAGNDPISLVTRDSGSQHNLAAATEAYNKSDYNAAIPFLETALQNDETNIKCKVILSRCYIETGAYQKAFALLDTIAAGESAYKFEASWLKGLAYLKLDDATACKEVLQQIPADAVEYSKARALLEQLK